MAKHLYTKWMFSLCRHMYSDYHIFIVEKKSLKWKFISPNTCIMRLTSAHMNSYIQYVILYVDWAVIEQDEAQSRFFNSLILLWLVYMLSYLLFFVVKLFSSFLRSKLSHMKKIVRFSVHKTSFCFLKIVNSSDLQLRYLAINFFQCIFV